MTEFPEPSTPTIEGRKWGALISVAFGAFMAPLDSSIVNTVLPLIAREFAADVLLIEWVILAYLLSLSSLLLIGGRLGDLFGDKRLYVSGFALFTLSSMLCGLATGVETLIAARVLQAIGGAMLIAIGPAILTRAFPAWQRGRALGIQASVVYLGLSVGPGLGGAIASVLGWRWVFFINLPIGIVAIGVALAVLRTGRPMVGPTGFDFTGAASFMGTLFCFVFALSRGAAWGWTSRAVWVAGAAAAAGAILFCSTELRSPQPFFDLRLFRHRLFAAATVSALLNYMAANTTAFLTPFFLIQGNRMTPAHAGSLLMTMPLVMAVVAPVSGWLSDHIGSRIPTVAGMACLASGMWLLARLDLSASDHQIALRLALAGLGIGLFTSPNNSAIMGAVPQGYQGLASGIVATARSVGMVLGVAVSGSLFGAEVQTLLAALGGEPLAVAGAYRHAVTIGAGIALAGAFTSLVRGEGAGGRNFKLKTDNRQPAN
ncbi:MAG: MFS transporter, partial [candidate division NC10 bacterium]|nr:MFS transporter [candidate division NC10 bacterium]